MNILNVDQTSPDDWSFLQENIYDWWVPEKRNFPWRQPSAEWQKLVTEVLLQRTRAEAVRSIYASFFNRFPTPSALSEASTDEIAEAIYSLGLAWRAKYLGQLGEELRIRSGNVPDSSMELQQLSGVGSYVSGAFQVLHRNRPESFVDANVVRLLGRYFGFEWDGETRRKKWFLRLVERLFSHKYEPEKFGYALLDFTREICSTPPKCDICPLQAKCDYGKTLQPETSLIHPT